MLKVESNITTDKPHELWSPELHNTLCIVSTLKVLLIQAITKLLTENKLNSTRSLWNLQLIYLGYSS